MDVYLLSLFVDLLFYLYIFGTFFYTLNVEKKNATERTITREMQDQEYFQLYEYLFHT